MTGILSISDEQLRLLFFVDVHKDDTAEVVKGLLRFYKSSLTQTYQQIYYKGFVDATLWGQNAWSVCGT